MGLYAIAVIADINKNIIGYRLIDDITKDKFDETIGLIRKRLDSKEGIENLTMRGRTVVYSDGDKDGLSVVINNKATSNKIVVINQVENYGYTVAFPNGKVQFMTPDELFLAIYKNNSANMKIDNKVDFDVIKTKLKTIPLKPDDGKYQAMIAFKQKQEFLGKRIFDFEYTDYNREIIITRYYDDPSRDTVIIPSFVSGIRSYSTGDYTCMGIFSRCRYIKKVIMSSSVHGELDALFRDARSVSLDLTEFDMTNISSVKDMFKSARIGCIEFGDDMHTKNVESFVGMFTDFCGNVLDLGGIRIGNKHVNVRGMFEACNIKELIIGSEYSVNSSSAMFLFYCAKIFTLRLRTTIVDNYDEAYKAAQNCEIKNLYIDVDKVDDVKYAMRLLSFGEIEQCTLIQNQTN